MSSARSLAGAVWVALPVLAVALAGSPASAQDRPRTAVVTAVQTAAECVGGMAGEFPCRNVDLLARLPLPSIGGGAGNDIWGWTDPQTGREYALMGRSNGTAFVDVSTPTSPVYLGNLPTATSNSSWRDIKVHANHAYVVSEAGSHGLQVFDLTRLRNVSSPPVTFDADYRDTSFGNAHNLAVNTDSGYAFVTGSNTCGGGPRMFDLSSPKRPAFAGCVSGDGYTHDTHAVIYHGPDTAHQGNEILANSNEDTVTVFDVTAKSNPTMLSRKTYPNTGYAHQGWFTEDHRYFLFNDETDESDNGFNTRTHVWDMADLDNPVLLGHYSGETRATSHNQYVKGGHDYESNYKAGLRIIDLTNVADPATMTEAAFFDVYPESDAAGYSGAWSNYPFFGSGTVIVSSIDRGLFVLRPNLQAPADDFSLSVSPESGSVDPGGSVSGSVVTATVSGDPQSVSLSASGVPSGVDVTFDPSPVTSGGSSAMTVTAAGAASPGTYQITVTGTGVSATRTDTFALTVNGAPGCAASNPADVAISDHATVRSQVDISGCDGNASAGSAVRVDVVHTYIGDLVVDLVAADGSVYRLHDRSGGSADDIHRTYPVDLSDEPANGTWTLRVSDQASNDVGRIDFWGLDLAAAGDPGGCAGLETVKTGTLSSGASDYQPDGSYFYTGDPGSHAGCLDAPDGVDFDLYLQKWNGSWWSTVARSTSPGPDEAVSYDGTAGYYRYRVHAYSGSGTYTLGYDAP